MEQTVTITKEEYQNLLESQSFLDALSEAGVDNWSGYDDALRVFRGLEVG